MGGFYTVILSGPVKDLPSFMVIFYAASAGIIVALVSTFFNPDQKLVSAEVSLQLGIHSDTFEV